MSLSSRFNLLVQDWKLGKHCDCDEAILPIEDYPCSVSTAESFSIMLEVLTALLGFNGLWDLSEAEVCTGCGLIYCEKLPDSISSCYDDGDLEEKLARRCIAKIRGILCNVQDLQAWAYPDFARYAIQQCSFDSTDGTFSRVLNFVMREYHYGGGVRHDLVSYGDWN